ncbi:MAG: DUF4190 domain-containing protein [Actinobacteria bacterium]|nr:MAG: DUF4190 domain-containing protein [Actinomycetota bacterium]
MRECAYCHAVNPDEAYFCDNCGFMIVPAGEAGSAISPPPGAHPPYPGETGAAGAGYNVGYYQQFPPVQVAAVNSNGKAIASLVLGIFGLVSCPIVCSIIGLILAYQARREIAASGGWQTGEGLARAGIILGWGGIAVYSLVFLIAVIATISANAVFIPFYLK